jgi:hypothetical protein
MTVTGGQGRWTSCVEFDGYVGAAARRPTGTECSLSAEMKTRNRHSKRLQKAKS